MPREICVCCGSKDLTSAVVRPTEAPIGVIDPWRLKETHYPGTYGVTRTISASICETCGHVEFFTDPKRPAKEPGA